MFVAEIVAGAGAHAVRWGLSACRFQRETRAGMTSVVHPADTVDGGQREAADTGIEGESGGRGPVIDGLITSRFRRSHGP